MEGSGQDEGVIEAGSAGPCASGGGERDKAEDAGEKE
jgi:hypothetical protein